MYNPVSFGSGNVLPRQFGVVNWCIIKTEINTSKHFHTLAVAENPFDVRQNRPTKELRIIPHPGRKIKKTGMADVDHIMETRHFVDLNFLCVSNRKSRPRWRLSRIMGVLVIEPRIIASL
jgi:hypothetical protein